MAETRIADNVWWHVNKEARRQEKQAKPKSRIDAKFEEWAQRNGVALKELPIMRKEKKDARLK